MVYISLVILPEVLQMM